MSYLHGSFEKSMVFCSQQEKHFLINFLGGQKTMKKKLLALLMAVVMVFGRGTIEKKEEGKSHVLNPYLCQYFTHFASGVQVFFIKPI